MFPLGMASTALFGGAGRTQQGLRGGVRVGIGPGAAAFVLALAYGSSAVGHG
jgi:hypothetical protein